MIYGIPRVALCGALVALTLGSTGIASAQESVPVPATESLFISAGCPPSTPGTCTSTRWLGKSPGDATSNFITSVTPVDEVFYRVDGSLNWRNYPSNETIRKEGYALRSAENMEMKVGVSTTGLAANMTVHARVEGLTPEGDLITFGTLEKVLTMTPLSVQTVDFSFDIADDLDGKVLSSVTAYVAVHGVNIQGGYINQQGGSTLSIPYWVESE